MIDTMTPVIKWLLYAMLVIVLGSCAMVLESQPPDDTTCQPFNAQDIERDVTTDILYIYDLYYRQHRHTEANILFYDYYQSNFGWGLGTYRTPDDLWIQVVQYDDGTDGIFFVWVGEDWSIGSDGARHHPCGIFILNRFKRNEYERVT